MLQTRFESLFPWLRQRREALALAQRIETLAWHLDRNNLETASNPPGDVIAVLESARSMLESALQRQRATPVQEEKTPTPAVVPAVEPRSVSDMPREPAAERTVLPEEPGRLAKDLIRLRDQLLLAQSGGKTPAPETLRALYHKMGQALAQEGFVALEEIGEYDYNRQEVVATCPTDDPALDDRVSDTVRPGYLYNGNLFRAQEVILFKYDPM